MKLVSVTEMRVIEQEADAAGLTYAKMMEKAGDGLAREILMLPYSADEQERGVLGLVGSGNNGGDTLVALTRLAANGWRARAYLVGRQPDGDPLVERLKKEGGEVSCDADDPGFDRLAAFLGTVDVVVDGLLGTGVKLPLRENVASVLAATNKALGELPWPPYVVAVDCPSGVDCDSGETAPEVVPASLTVSIAAVKQGLVEFPAFEMVGELRIVDIGLTKKIKAWSALKRDVADEELVEEILPARPPDAHKGTFGTLLIAAGSVNYTGAALLAGRAAYRIGAGLVQMAVPGQVQAALAGHFPEATWIILPQEMGVIAASAVDVLVKNLDRATALLIGPGFGMEDATQEFVENLLVKKIAANRVTAHIGFVHAESTKDGSAQDVKLPPMVADADGLKLLAKIEGWPQLLPGESVLTPHPGEMAVLTGLTKDEIQQDRMAVALQYAAEWGHVVVLKGAFTVIAAPDGRATLIPVASSALARAGTGDVLAGLVAGLRAQGVAAYEAAVAAAWIHAQAGLYAAEKIGSEASVLAGDVVEAIGDVMSGF